MLIVMENEKITGYEAFCLYLGLKSHFNTKTYDFFRYGAKKIKQNTYMSRNDRIFFEKIAKKYKKQFIIDFIIANLLENSNFWVKDFFSSECEDTYLRWKRRTESMEYVFRSDCEIILDFLESSKMTFQKLFTTDNQGNHPVLLKMLMRKDVSPETFCALDSILSFTVKWNSLLANDPVWDEMKTRYSKYVQFLGMDGQRRAKFKEILLDSLKRRDILQ
jgi:hypothetical protein